MAIDNLKLGFNIYPSPLWLIPSVLWLLFVLLIIVASVAMLVETLIIYGIRGCVLNCMECFSGHRFIETLRMPNGSLCIRFGFRFFSSEFYQDAILPIDFLRVSWSKGQLSCYSGEDRDDWSVAIWWRTNTRRWRLGRRAPASQNQGYRSIGCGGKKDETIEYGLRFIEFLNRSGVELIPEEREHSYCSRIAGGID